MRTKEVEFVIRKKKQDTTGTILSAFIITEEILNQCHELGATIAGGCQMGIY